MQDFLSVHATSNACLVARVKIKTQQKTLLSGERYFSLSLPGHAPLREYGAKTNVPISYTGGAGVTALSPYIRILNLGVRVEREYITLGHGPGLTNFEWKGSD